MRPLLILSVLLWVATQGLAQQYTINGKVTDDQSQPIAYVNVLLLTAADSTLVKGAVSEEDGDYMFSATEAGNYLIKTSFVGYAETYSKVFALDSNKQISTISMEQTEESLETITLTSRRPTIQRKVDRLIFNVENTVVSSGNTFDILKRTPGVVVSQGQIMVRNSPAVVYINDRKVYLTSDELQQLLEGFSGENVKSVEVITTPPARYDAEGGSILNIVTSKNLSIGYKGSIYGSNTQARVPKYSVGTSHYYKNNWLNAFGSYSFNTRRDNKQDDSRVRFFEPNGNVNSEWFTDFNKDSHTNLHSLNAILDFTINDKNTLSLSSNLLFTPKYHADQTGLTNIYGADGQLDSLFTTNSRYDYNKDNLLFNLDYVLKLDEEGAAISTKTNYIFYRDDQRQTVMTRYELPDGDLINENSFLTLPFQKTHIYTGQADYNDTFGEWIFESGLKYSGIRSNSKQDFLDTNGDVDLKGIVADNFDYDENIYAGYLSISHDWEKWSFKAGLRGEYTDANGNSLVLGKVNTQEYFEPFPTVYLRYNPNEKDSYGFNYSQRITRPRFDNLNPFRTFINENSFNQGNPNIQPSITDRIELNYSLNNIWTVQAYYERINDEINVLPFQDNQNRLLSSLTSNLNFSEQYSLDLTYVNYISDDWYLYAYGSLFYLRNEFIGQASGNQTVTKDMISAYLETQSYFTFLEDKTLSAIITASFLPNIIQGSYVYDKPTTDISIGIQKTFFDRRLTATIDANDIFKTVNFPVTSQYLNQDNSFFAKPESRSIRFGIRYNFGNFNLEDNERALDVEENKRLKEK